MRAFSIWSEFNKTLKFPLILIIMNEKKYQFYLFDIYYLKNEGGLQTIKFDRVSRAYVIVVMSYAPH